MSCDVNFLLQARESDSVCSEFEMENEAMCVELNPMIIISLAPSEHIHQCLIRGSSPVTQGI